MTRYGREITRSPAVEEAYWLGAGGAPRAGTLDEFMALIADGQQAVVDDVRAAIPRGIDPTVGEIGGLDASASRTGSTRSGWTTRPAARMRRCGPGT
jgi:hypothetical protein